MHGGGGTDGKGESEGKKCKRHCRYMLQFIRLWITLPLLAIIYMAL